MSDRRAFLVGLGSAVLAVPARAAVDAPFRRMTNPLLVPVTITNGQPVASSLMVPAGFFTGPNGAYTSFHVSNPNRCYVRLQGFTDANAANEVVTSTAGWCFEPGADHVYTTQITAVTGSTAYLSTIPYDTPLYPLAAVNTTVPLELSYGYGA